jgi:hypothetical protein
MASGPASDGERLTAVYLRRRGWPYEYEPDIGGKNPDFLATTQVGPVVLEVFEPRLELAKGEGGWLDSIEPVLGLFEARKRAQIAAVKEAGLPLILVLGSANSDIPYGQHSVTGAMFGRPGVKIPVDVPDPAEHGEWMFLGGARLQRERNTGVSAIATINRFNPTQWRLDAARRQERGLEDRKPIPFVGPEAERYGRDACEIARIRHDIREALTARGVFDPDARVARLSIYHNPYALHPLDLRFGGPHDDQYSFVEVGPGRVGYGLVASGVRGWELPG